MKNIIILSFLACLAHQAHATPWSVTSEKSKKDDSEVFYLSVDSNEKFAKFGRREPVTLLVRCIGKKNEIFINWNQFISTQPKTVFHRFDKKKGQNTTWDNSSDYKASFYRGNKSGFIKEILAANELVVEVVPHGENPLLATFDLTKSKQAFEQAGKGCKY